MTASRIQYLDPLNAKPYAVDLRAAPLSFDQTSTTTTARRFHPSELFNLNKTTIISLLYSSWRGEIKESLAVITSLLETSAGLAVMMLATARLLPPSKVTAMEESREAAALLEVSFALILRPSNQHLTHT